MIGGNELFILIIAGILIYGFRNASQIGMGLGKGLQSFKRAAKGVDEIDITPVEPVEQEFSQEENRDIGKG